MGILKLNKLFTGKLGVFVTALICTTLWGTAFPVIKLAYKEMYISAENIGGKLLFAGERFALAGAMVFIFALVINRKLPRMGKKDVMPILALGVVQTFLQYLFSYIGVANTTGTKTSVITACNAFIAVLAAPLIYKSDRLNTQKIIGCIFGAIGIAAINFDGAVFDRFAFFGEGFVFISAVCSAAGGFISKAAMKGRNAMQVTSFQLLIGGALLIIAGGALGGNMYYTRFTHYFLLIYLALVSAVAFTLWTALLAYNPVSRICIYNLLIPIFGIIWSGILLGENILTLNNLLSVLLVSAGIWLVNLEPHRLKNRTQL